MTKDKYAEYAMNILREYINRIGSQYLDTRAPKDWASLRNALMKIITDMDELKAVYDQEGRDK